MREDRRPIGYWLKRLDGLIEENFERTLAGDGVTRRQWQALNTLHQRPSTQAELGQAMTDAALTNVVFVAFAALTVRLYRPLLRKADPAPPGVRHPDVRAPHPRMRPPATQARTPTVLHHLTAGSPCRSNPDHGDGRRTRPRLDGG